MNVTVQKKNTPEHRLQTNCCCFVEALLVRAFQEQDRRLQVEGEYHRAFMAIGDPYGPVHAAIELGFADPVPEEDYPKARWLLCQGWNASMTRGHTFIVVETDEDGCVLVLESNNSHAVRGVGWRGLGNVKHWSGKPKPPNWWNWDSLRRRYPNLRAAAIRLDDSP